MEEKQKKGLTTREWQKVNKDKQQGYVKKYYQKNKDHYRQRNLGYYHFKKEFNSLLQMVDNGNLFQ